MPKLALRPRALGRALLAAWRVWLCIGAIVGALLACLALAPTDVDAFRLAGTALELFGLVAAATGLRQVRKQFGRPSTIDSARNWFRLLVKAMKQQEPISLQASGSVSTGGSASVTVLRGVSASATLEERVALLEGDVTALRNDIAQQRGRNEAETRELRDALKREAALRQGADERATKQLEEVSVGGLQLEKLGLCWLLFGILFANLSEEFADLLYLALASS